MKMRLVVKLAQLGLICGLFFSTQAYAAFEWKGPFSINDVAHMYHESHAVTTVTVDEKNLVNSGCAISDQQGIVSYWTTSAAAYVWNSQWLSMLMSAQSQNKQIMLFIDGANCSPWAGAHLNGVRILTDD